MLPARRRRAATPQHCERAVAIQNTYARARTKGYRFLADTAWRRDRPENAVARPNQGRHALRAPFEGKWLKSGCRPCTPESLTDQETEEGEKTTVLDANCGKYVAFPFRTFRESFGGLIQDETVFRRRKEQWGVDPFFPAHCRP